MIDLLKIAESDRWIAWTPRERIRQYVRLWKAAAPMLDAYNVAWAPEPLAPFDRRGGSIATRILRIEIPGLKASIHDHGLLSFYTVDAPAEEMAKTFKPTLKRVEHNALCFTTALIEATVAVVKILRAKSSAAEAALSASQTGP